MEDRFVEENVKQRLILSGISELEEHGIADFSLRRAALRAQVSCAAPYRHFKSKEEYVSEIIAYVGSKWELLSREISGIFKNDASALVIEMAIANLRFRIANRNLPLALAHKQESGKSIDESILAVVSAYCDKKGIDEEEKSLKVFSALALISGAVSMVSENNSDEILSLTRQKLEKEFP